MTVSRTTTAFLALCVAAPFVLAEPPVRTPMNFNRNAKKEVAAAAEEQEQLLRQDTNSEQVSPPPKPEKGSFINKNNNPKATAAVGATGDVKTEVDGLTQEELEKVAEVLEEVEELPDEPSKKAPEQQQGAEADQEKPKTGAAVPKEMTGDPDEPEMAFTAEQLKQMNPSKARNSLERMRLALKQAMKGGMKENNLNAKKELKKPKDLEEFIMMADRDKDRCLSPQEFLIDMMGSLIDERLPADATPKKMQEEAHKRMGLPPQTEMLRTNKVCFDGMAGGKPILRQEFAAEAPAPTTPTLPPFVNPFVSPAGPTATDPGPLTGLCPMEVQETEEISSASTLLRASKHRQPWNDGNSPPVKSACHEPGNFEEKVDPVTGVKCKRNQDTFLSCERHIESLGEVGKMLCSWLFVGSDVCQCEASADAKLKSRIGVSGILALERTMGGRDDTLEHDRINGAATAMPGGCGERTAWTSREIAVPVTTIIDPLYINPVSAWWIGLAALSRTLGPAEKDLLHRAGLPKELFTELHRKVLLQEEEQAGDEDPTPPPPPPPAADSSEAPPEDLRDVLDQLLKRKELPKDFGKNIANGPFSKLGDTAAAMKIQECIVNPVVSALAMDSLPLHYRNSQNRLYGPFHSGVLALGDMSVNAIDAFIPACVREASAIKEEGQVGAAVFTAKEVMADKKDVCMLSFKSTKGRSDVLADFASDIDWWQFGDGGIHSGFRHYYRRARCAWEKAFEEQCCEKLTWPFDIVISGHSMGGAIASIAASDTVRNFQCKGKQITPEMVTIVALASPATGDSQFVEGNFNCDGPKCLKGRHVAFAVTGDTVPYLDLYRDTTSPGDGIGSAKIFTSGVLSIHHISEPTFMPRVEFDGYGKEGYSHDLQHNIRAYQALDLGTACNTCGNLLFSTNRALESYAWGAFGTCAASGPCVQECATLGDGKCGVCPKPAPMYPTASAAEVSEKVLQTRLLAGKDEPVPGEAGDQSKEPITPGGEEPAVEANPPASPNEEQQNSQAAKENLKVEEHHEKRSRWHGITDHAMTRYHYILIVVATIAMLGTAAYLVMSAANSPWARNEEDPRAPLTVKTESNVTSDVVEGSESSEGSSEKIVDLFKRVQASLKGLNQQAQAEGMSSQQSSSSS